MSEMCFIQVDRYLTGGQMSPIVVVLTFEGEEMQYHEDFYFEYQENFYSLSCLGGMFLKEKQFIEWMGDYKEEQKIIIKKLQR